MPATHSMRSNETEVKEPKFSSNLIDLLKILSSLQINFNCNVFVKGQLNIHVDNEESVTITVDECIQVKDNNCLEFISNTFSKFPNPRTDERKDEKSEKIAAFPVKTTDTVIVEEEPFELSMSENTAKSPTHENGKKQNKSSKYSCKPYDKVFDRKAQLTSHEEIKHLGSQIKNLEKERLSTKSEVCAVCGKSFASKLDLQKHSVTHVKVKLFPCEVEGCDKTYVSEIAFKNHMYFHTGAKQFECDICQKKLSNSSALEKHQLVHTKEKNHICEYCGKSFSQKNGVKKHWNYGRCSGRLDGKMTKTNEGCNISEVSNKKLKKSSNETFDSTVCENDLKVWQVTTNVDGTEEVKILELDQIK